MSGYCFFSLRHNYLIKNKYRDEYSGQVIGYKKKFKADKLQKTYEQLGNRYGISKRQAKDACDFLKDKGIISVEFRDLKTPSGLYMSNVMFVEPIIENLKKITGINRIFEGDGETGENNNDIANYTPVKKDVVANVPPPTIKCTTPLQSNGGGSYV